MGKTSNFNRVLAAGIVIALVLMGIAAIYAARIVELAISQKESGENRNPLLHIQRETVVPDSGDPEIPGVTVYNAKQDAATIIKETRQQELNFTQSNTANSADKEYRKSQRLIKEKDQFAAERLIFLQKIESAKTREERIKLIEELRQHCKTPTKS